MGVTVQSELTLIDFEMDLLTAYLPYNGLNQRVKLLRDAPSLRSAIFHRYSCITPCMDHFTRAKFYFHLTFG